MNETDITFQKLNNNDTIFFVGNSPTVTFNDNVTVYIYPRISYIDSSVSENLDIRNKNFYTKTEIVDEKIYTKSGIEHEKIDTKSGIEHEKIDTKSEVSYSNKIFAFLKKCIKKISI